MKTPGKKSLIIRILIIATGLLLVGALSFFIWHSTKLTEENNRLKAEKNEIETKKKEKSPNSQGSTKTPAATPTPAPAEPAFRPSDAMIENIAAILNTMNTQPFEGYAANEVSLYYASNEPSVTLNDKTQIAKSLEYFSDAKEPWDLKLPSDIIARYKKKFDKLFGDGCLAGHSADATHVVSFCFNKEGKIYSIFLCRDPRVFN